MYRDSGKENGNNKDYRDFIGVYNRGYRDTSRARTVSIDHGICKADD